jgi:hypothetical protein
VPPALQQRRSPGDAMCVTLVSNTGFSDEFGYSAALSGDILAVGARYEDSAATDVNGNQADNSTTDSGAVYIFH